MYLLVNCMVTLKCPENISSCEECPFMNECVYEEETEENDILFDENGECDD